MIDVAIVTCAELPELFPDDQVIPPALRKRGLSHRIVAWDDSSFDWTSARIAFLRSPWDYYKRPAEFLDWLTRVHRATEVVNPVELVRWNLHKRYLLELAEMGAPVVPTALLSAGSNSDLAALVAARGWSRVVVKPAVSADSWETLFVDSNDSARGQAHVDRLLPERDLLVQPFVASVEEYGERCLVFLEGRFSHAVRKNALTKGGRWAGLPEGVPVEATAGEIATALSILDLADATSLLYARVDLTRDATGAPLLLELELAEPTLFLEGAPATAVDRLLDGLVRRMRS